MVPIIAGIDPCTSGSVIDPGQPIRLILCLIGPEVHSRTLLVSNLPNAPEMGKAGVVRLLVARSVALVKHSLTGTNPCREVDFSMGEPLLRRPTTRI
jgi:hypothetical protein